MKFIILFLAIMGAVMADSKSGSGCHARDLFRLYGTSTKIQR